MAFGLPGPASGQSSRAVGIAVDAAQVEFDNARAQTVAAQERYSQQSQELATRVARGEIPLSRASQLQRFFQLDIVDAQMDEALAYLRVIDSRTLDYRTKRDEYTKAINDVRGILNRNNVQRQQLARELRERRGPAVLVGREYTALTGGRIAGIGDDQQMLNEIEGLLKRYSASQIEAENALSALQREIDVIDRNLPLLEARRGIANQLVELLRMRAILLRAGAGAGASEPLPDVLTLEPLPSLFGPSPGTPLFGEDVVDPDALRRRLEEVQ
ncbi:MAG: hypothetical protein HY657_09465 [Acidobacteria bacterium]|nr:hypothetical protein [Acidobacteriota bacterium]